MPHVDSDQSVRMRTEYMFITYVHMYKNIKTYPKSRGGLTYKSWTKVAEVLGYKKLKE